jgi:DNA-binding CsgD family transcriptional regulator
VDEERFKRLTERQRECLRLIYAHHSIKEIARLLGLSEDGVKWHLREAREALGVGRSTEAARLVYGDAPPQTYPRRVGPPGAVSPSGPDAMMAPSPEQRGGRASDDVLREPQATYRVEGPFDDGHGLRLPIPTAGRPRNDLTAIEKLAWGLAIGILAALLLGALTSLQHTIL